MNITKLYQINTNQRKFTKSICSPLCFGIFMDFSCPLPLSGAVAPSYMALRRGKWSRGCNPKASKPSPWHNRKSSNRTGFEQWFPVYVFIYIYIYVYDVYVCIYMIILYMHLSPCTHCLPVYPRFPYDCMIPWFIAELPIPLDIWISIYHCHPTQTLICIPILTSI